jgi:hypothetical protein
VHTAEVVSQVTRWRHTVQAQFRPLTRAGDWASLAAWPALWSPTTLLVAAVLATTLVPVGLATQQSSDPAPPAKPPMHERTRRPAG